MSLHELLDERQRKECDFAVNYRDNFNHGTPSHNHLILIAKLYQHAYVMEQRIDDPIFLVDVAQKAFEAYRQRRGGIAFEGSPIPDWANTAPGVREAWIVAAETVAKLFIL